MQRGFFSFRPVVGLAVGFFAMLVIVLIAWQAADAARMPLNVYIPSSIAASATPEIHLQPTLGTRIASFFRREKPIVTKISLTDAAGKQISVPFGRQTATLTNATTIVIPKTENFHPGKYQASVTTRQGNTERTVTQDFDWGILALNVPSATVQPWEDVPLHMAVLDDKGDMVCDANVAMTIITPDGKKELLQTGDAINTKWRIRTNPSCAIKARTDQSDYEAHYRPITAGTYSVHVVADTKNGRRELNDTFQVNTALVFSVRRSTFPTRIYPAASYPVEFVVRPSQDYKGTFTESVPGSFMLSSITNNGTVRLASAEKKIITWNVDWQAGQTYRLGYTFDAPDTSPAFYQLGPYSTSSTIEARQWQIAVDATKTWDGGGGDGLWSTAANWNNDTLPVAGDDIVFDGTSGSANATWDSAFAVDTIGSLTDTRTAGTIIFTKTPVTVTNAFSSTGTGGAITFTGSASVTVGGNFTLTSTGAFTANTSTLTLTGTSNSFNSGKSFNNLTIDPSTTGTVTVSTNDPSVNGTLTIAASDTLSIGSFRNVKVNYGGTVTINSTGTISGSGTLYLYDATLGTVGTLNSQVTFDLTSGDYSIPARTYGGAVTITTGFPGGGTTATLGTATGQTLTFSGNLTLDDTATLGLTIAGNTYNPTVNITGNFTANTIDSAGYVVNTGTGTWTVGGNFNLTNMGSFTHGGTLVMNGASKTLTSNGKTLNNVTLSGTITLANATHTVAGNLDLTGGTITAGTSTVKMTGTGGKTITGGGVTIANLTIDPTSADTITLQTTDLTVSSTVSIAASDTLSIALGRTLTHTGATLTLTGTITGAGTYVYSSSTAFPTAGTISSALRFDSTNNAQTVSARTFGGAVEFYNNSASTARTITLGTFMLQLVTFSSNVTLNAANGGNITLSGATNNPTINITGDIDYTGIGAGTESITTGNLQWTVAGNVDFTDGTLTATTNNVFKMTGSKNLIGAGQTFYRLLIDGSGITVTVTTSDFTVSNLLTVGVALDNNDDTLSIASGRTVTSGTGSTVTLTGSGTDSITGAGTLIVQNSNLGTLGTLSSGVRFDATSGDISIPQRTYGGAVEAYSNSSSAARVITAGTAASQTLTFQSTLTVTANNSQNVTFAAATNSPAVSLTGDLTCSKPSTGQPVITSGTGTWTIAGNVDFTNCTYTATSGNTIKMTGTKNLIGNGQSLSNLTIDGVNTTVTVTTSDVTISGTLTIGGVADGDNDTLSIGSSRTVTSGTAGTVTLVGSGTDSISGSGTLTVQNSNLGTSGTLSSIVRFDATSGTITMPARTYVGALQIYSNASDASKSVTMASGTHVFSSTLTVIDDNTQSVTLDGATNSASATITGNVAFTKNSSGTPSISTGSSANTWSAAGNVNFTSGTFTAGSGNTVTMNGTAAQTLTSASQTFNNLTLNNTGTAGTTNDDIIPADAVTVNGVLIVTQGELKLSTNNPNLSVGGNVSIASSGIMTKGTGTLTFNGTTAATYADSTSTPQNLGTVAVNKTNTSSPSTNDKLTLASSMTVDTLTIDGTSGQADTLDLGSSGYTLTLANTGSTSTVLTVNGTLTAGTSTVNYSATNSSGNVNIATVNYNSLTVSGAETYVVSGDITVSGALTTSSNNTLSLSSGKTLTHTGSSMTNNGTISGSGTLLFTAASSGPGTSGTIASTVRYDASSGDIGSSTVDARTYDGSVVFYANSASAHTITFASGTYTLSGGSADFTVTNDGAGSLTVDATANPDVTVGGSFSFVGAGTETLKSGTGIWTFSGNVNLSNGIFTATSGNTLAMDGSGKTLTTAGQTLYNLTISGGSIAASGTTTVANTLTISAGALTAPSGTLNVGGNFSNSATFTANGGTVVLTAASGTKTITNSGTGSFSGLTLSGGATWQMGSVLTVSDLTISSGTLNQGNKNLTINSSLTISGGTFSGGTGALDINGTLTLALGTMTAPSGDTTLSGDFLHTGGTFTHNTGTIVLDGSNQTISGTTTFYNLTKVISTTARTLTFPVGATQTIVGSLTLKGADGAALSLRSSSAGTQWIIDPQGMRTIQYLDVQDSDNINTAKIATVGFSVTNSGNNTGWAFPPNAPTGFSGTAVSSTSILWTWTDASNDETGFKLEAADGTVLLTVDSANTQSVAETGLVHGTDYTRQVVAYNADGVSSPSATDTVPTRASAPTIPELVSPSENALLNTLTPAFSFDRSTDADDGMGTYTLFLNPGFDTAKTVFLGNVPTSGTQSQDFASVTGTADAGTAQLTDNTLLNEGSNTWQIRATDTAENSSDSVVRTLVIDVTKPTLTAFSLTPQATGSKTSAYLSTSQRPTLTLTAQDSYQLQKVVVHFLRRRFLLGEEIGTTEELTRTVLVSGTQQTVAVTPVSPLPYGVYTLRMETFDAAGNSSMTERSVTLQTAEKITQRPTTPGATPSQEREKEIEQGTTPTKVPVDLTLPSLEKHAFERREKEAANLTGFLQHFIPQSRLDRFELSMNHTVTQARALVSTLARSTGRHLAAFFGFSTDALAQLRLLMQLPACGSDCATQEQLVRATPLGATLNNIFPKATGRFLVTWKTFQNRATRLLIAGRKNRSHVAGRSEASIARALQPVAHTVQWIGIGVRVALEGMRGKYDQRLQITNVAIKSLVPDSTTVSWTTNRVSKGKINYGQTISYGQEALEQSFVLNHTIELKGLQPATKYYFEVLETDVGGEQTFDAYYGFTTPVL